MCIDSKAVNKITINYHFPILCLNGLLDQLYGTFIFSKIDFQIGYHQIQIKSGDERNIEFKRRDGLMNEWPCLLA